MAITVDSAGTNQSQGVAASLTFSHTCSGSNRLLAVCISTVDGVTASSITYNGINLTLQVEEDFPILTSGNAEIWTLTAPTEGANNVIITWSTAIVGLKKVVAISFNGVHQTSPVMDTDNIGNNVGMSGQLAYDEVEGFGNMILSAICLGTGSAEAPTAGTGFTQQSSVFSDGFALGVLTASYDFQLESVNRWTWVTGGTDYRNVGIYLLQMPETITKEIERPISTVFRRCEIKRRSVSTGLYESNWFDVSEYVKSWGSFRRSVDDLRLNRFTHSGVTFVMNNDSGAFNREDNISSLWNGYLTRYRTLLRIQSGYVQDDESELPTDTTIGIFIMADEIPIDAKQNEATLQCRSLVSIFDEVRAADVAGLGSTQTASDIITKIKNHTDGSSNSIFQQFISSGAWIIQSTTSNYNLSTSTSIGSMTCWDLMTKIAETEGYLLFINRTGGFEFRDRNERTSTSQFSFKGQGFPTPNIIEMRSFKEALNKYYNYFRLKWNVDDTTTSYVTAGTVTAVDPSNSSWKYGSRVYEFDNDFFQTNTTAQTIVNNLFSTFSELKNETTIKTRFVPQLDISDKISLFYKTYDISEVAIWDLAIWDEDYWPDSGENFDINDQPYKILSIQTDLNNFTTTFNIREL